MLTQNVQRQRCVTRRLVSPSTIVVGWRGTALGDLLGDLLVHLGLKGLALYATRDTRGQPTEHRVCRDEYWG